ncbi:MAG: hypothetical protein ACYSSO_08480 [Planctomycetota bacterium]|jgi:hypothetical protein
MIKKFYLFIGIVFILSGGLCAFGQANDPNAAEVLRRYAQSLSYLQSVPISMKIQIEIDVDANHPNKWYCPYERHFLFLRDGERAEWRGQLLIFDDQGNEDPNKSRVIKQIMTGELYANVIGTLLNAPPRAVSITRDYKEAQENLLDDSEYGGPLFGRIYGNSHKNVAELLSGDPNVYLRDEQENINGVPCYVLEATTEHGKVTAWIAPEKGYNALKWSIHKTSGNLYDDRPLSSNSWLAVFDAVQLQKVSDVFVTTGGCLTHTIDRPERQSVSTDKYKVSEVQLNPDFDILGAFKVNLPNGTRVFMKEYPAIRYAWQNGKIAPAEDMTFGEIDKMVDELKK